MSKLYMLHKNAFIIKSYSEALCFNKLTLTICYRRHCNTNNKKHLSLTRKNTFQLLDNLTGTQVFYKCGLYISNSIKYK